VPSLSWRDAAYHLLATNASGFLFDEVYLDHGHPNGECGHRCLHALAASARPASKNWWQDDWLHRSQSLLRHCRRAPVCCGPAAQISSGINA